MVLKKRYLMWVLWPSFLVAGLLSAMVFALIDPLDIKFFGHLNIGRMPAYSIGFFIFWFMTALSSAYTLKLSPKGQVVDDFGEPLA